MKNKTIWDSRFAAPLTAATTLALAANAGAQTGTGPTFDTANLQSTSTAVLAVGALIAVGFAVFKIGKRAMNKV